VFVFATLAIAAAAVTILLQRRLSTLLIGLVAVMLVLNTGWYEYQMNVLQPVRDDDQRFAFDLLNQVKPAHPLAFVWDQCKNYWVIWGVAFWTDNDTRVYGWQETAPWWGGGGMMEIKPNRKLGFGGFAPDYIVSGIDLSLPLVKNYTPYGMRLYKNARGNASTVAGSR